jgi:hypothetical protein
MLPDNLFLAEIAQMPIKYTTNHQKNQGLCRGMISCWLLQMQSNDLQTHLIQNVSWYV